MLGILYSRSWLVALARVPLNLSCRIEKPRVKEALVLLKQVLEASPEDTDTLIEICELQVQHDTEQAKHALDKLKHAPDENVPMEFWNNVGAVLQKLGEPAGATKQH